MTAPPLIALLAAGSARRFGANKLAADCAGLPLGSHAARAVRATGLQALCIIPPGAPPTWLPAGIAALPNPHADTGLASSVALAAEAARDRGAPALILALADMPCVPPALLVALAAAPAAAACRYPSGRPGVPAKFTARRYADLAALTGERGAAALLAGDPAVMLVDCDPDDLVDVDTPAGLARAAAILAARAS